MSALEYLNCNEDFSEFQEFRGKMSKCSSWDASYGGVGVVIRRCSRSIIGAGGGGIHNNHVAKLSKNGCATNLRSSKEMADDGSSPAAPSLPHHYHCTSRKNNDNDNLPDSKKETTAFSAGYHPHHQHRHHYHPNDATQVRLIGCAELGTPGGEEVDNYCARDTENIMSPEKTSRCSTRCSNTRETNHNHNHENNNSSSSNDPSCRESRRLDSHSTMTPPPPSPASSPQTSSSPSRTHTSSSSKIFSSSPLSSSATTRSSPVFSTSSVSGVLVKVLFWLLVFNYHLSVLEACPLVCTCKWKGGKQTVSCLSHPSRK